MSDATTLDRYGTLTAPDTLTIQRLLPGPIERVWAYLTESDKRQEWFASGDMVLQADTPLTLTWRNDELTDPPGQKPPGAGKEHSMECRITACEPPRKLAHTFGAAGEVSYTLEPHGDAVLLTLVHSRLPDRSMVLNVSAGWHSHLDILADRLEGRRSAPFWDRVSKLKGEYETRLPA